MSESEQTILHELSRMVMEQAGPTQLSDFISKRIIRLFAAKHHMVWQVREGLVYPSDWIGKTSYPLNDGVWDKLAKHHKPILIDLAEMIVVARAIHAAWGQKIF